MKKVISYIEPEEVEKLVGADEIDEHVELNLVCFDSEGNIVPYDSYNISLFYAPDNTAYDKITEEDIEDAWFVVGTTDYAGPGWYELDYDAGMYYQCQNVEAWKGAFRAGYLK